MGRASPVIKASFLTARLVRVENEIINLFVLAMKWTVSHVGGQSVVCIVLAGCCARRVGMS